MILGDLSILADGGPVEVAPATGEAKVASATLDLVEIDDPGRVRQVRSSLDKVTF